jgi:hypothetical protein
MTDPSSSGKPVTLLGWFLGSEARADRERVAIAARQEADRRRYERLNLPGGFPIDPSHDPELPDVAAEVEAPVCIRADRPQEAA